MHAALNGAESVSHLLGPGAGCWRSHLEMDQGWGKNPASQHLSYIASQQKAPSDVMDESSADRARLGDVQHRWGPDRVRARPVVRSRQDRRLAFRVSSINLVRPGRLP